MPGGNKVEQKKENVGKITVTNGEASEERVEQELKHLIDNKWQWRVKRIAEKEYLAIFPNKHILQTF